LRVGQLTLTRKFGKPACNGFGINSLMKKPYVEDGVDPIGVRAKRKRPLVSIVNGLTDLVKFL